MTERQRRTAAPAAHAVFDRAGRFCAWLLTDRIVGEGGATQAWLHAGLVFSRAGTHIGSLDQGLLRGRDGSISGFIGGTRTAVVLPLCGVSPAGPVDATPPPRPALRASRSTTTAGPLVWSTRGWPAFLVPSDVMSSAQRPFTTEGAVPVLLG